MKKHLEKFHFNSFVFLCNLPVNNGIKQDINARQKSNWKAYWKSNMPSFLVNWIIYSHKIAQNDLDYMEIQEG